MCRLSALKLILNSTFLNRTWGFVYPSKSVFTYDMGRVGITLVAFHSENHIYFAL